MKFMTYLTLQIVLLFVIAIAGTFLGDYLQSINFFGDSSCTNIWHDRINCGEIDTLKKWGVRHYWYNWMCFVLFLLQIARIIIWINNYFDPKNKII